MNLKYKINIDLCGCDLSSFKEQERPAFRWVFEDITDTRNFLPRCILKPDMNQKECFGWSLSFFETKDEAISRHNYITKDKKYLYKKLGTHIAKGNLVNTDGISNNSNSFGHFEHFEYENIDLKTSFSIIEKIS